MTYHQLVCGVSQEQTTFSQLSINSLFSLVDTSQDGEAVYIKPLALLIKLSYSRALRLGTLRSINVEPGRRVLPVIQPPVPKE